MSGPEDSAAEGVEAAQKLQRVLTLFVPNATNVKIEHVDQNPRQIQITNFRAELPDGSTVHAPRITIALG